MRVKLNAGLYTDLLLPPAITKLVIHPILLIFLRSRAIHQPRQYATTEGLTVRENVHYLEQVKFLKCNAKLIGQHF